jgi:hypothetical protein
MIFIVAPFETENFSKEISSRNLELANISNESVKIICSSFDHRYKKYNSFSDCKTFVNKQNPKVELIHINTISYSKNISIARVLSNFIFAIRIFNYLLRNAKKNDTVLINSIPPEVIFFVSMASKIKRFNIILDVRDIWPDALISSNDMKATFFKWYCNFFYYFSSKKNIKHVIYVSKSFLPWIGRLGVSNQICNFLPLGYDKNRWSTELSKKKNLENRNHKMHLVYIGYLSDQFDLTNIIKIVNKLDSVELHIIGGGKQEAYYQSISNLEHIIFHGMKAPKAIPSILIDIMPDLAVLPLAEGAKALMPNKLFDYIANKLPIIVTGSDEAGDFVEEVGIGFSAVSTNDLEIKLNTLTKMELNEKRKKLFQMGDDYSMQKIYIKFRELLEKNESEK